jgi:hypothetical protein
MSRRLRDGASLREESLALFREMGDREGIAICLEGAARVAGAQGQPEQAVRLWAAAAHLREGAASQTPWSLADVFRWRPRTTFTAKGEREIDAVRAALGEEAFAAAGRAMSVEQAIACALGEEA